MRHWWIFLLALLVAVIFANVAESKVVPQNNRNFAYDTLGRMTAVTNALGYVTSYTYDELGQQLSQTDANNHTTTFEYDSLGRRVKRTLPAGEISISTAIQTGLPTMFGMLYGGYDAARRGGNVWDITKGTVAGGAMGAMMGPVFQYLPLLAIGPAGQMTLFMYAASIGASAALDAGKYPDLAALQVIGAFMPFLLTPRISVLLEGYSDQLMPIRNEIDLAPTGPTHPFAF